MDEGVDAAGLGIAYGYQSHCFLMHFKCSDLNKYHATRRHHCYTNNHTMGFYFCDSFSHFFSIYLYETVWFMFSKVIYFCMITPPHYSFIFIRPPIMIHYFVKCFFFFSRFISFYEIVFCEWMWMKNVIFYSLFKFTIVSISLILNTTPPPPNDQTWFIFHILFKMIHLQRFFSQITLPHDLFFK